MRAPSRARLAAWVVAIISLGFSSADVIGVGVARAQADRDPDGIVAFSVLVPSDTPSRVGGQLGLDLLHRPERAEFLRVGGYAALGILGGPAESTRVQLLAGPSLIVGAFPSPSRRVGVELRLRGGAWVGAGDWQAGDGTDLRAGGFVSGGAHLALGLGDRERRARLRLTVGLDLLHLFGPSAVTVYAPAVALAFSPDEAW